MFNLVAQTVDPVGNVVAFSPSIMVVVAAFLAIMSIAYMIFMDRSMNGFVKAIEKINESKDVEKLFDAALNRLKESQREALEAHIRTTENVLESVANSLPPNGVRDVIAGISDFLSDVDGYIDGEMVPPLFGEIMMNELTDEDDEESAQG